MVSLILKKILSEGHTKKWLLFIQNATNEKSSRFIIEVPKYISFYVNAENDGFLQLCGNQDRNKKN